MCTAVDFHSHICNPFYEQDTMMEVREYRLMEEAYRCEKERKRLITTRQ